MTHARDLQNGHDRRIIPPLKESTGRGDDERESSALHPHDDVTPRLPVLSALRRRARAPDASKRPSPSVWSASRCGFIFYLDPKIAVGTIIRTDSDRLVLVRRAIEPGYGKWVFPGGYVDRGETLT